MKTVTKLAIVAASLASTLAVPIPEAPVDQRLICTSETSCEWMNTQQIQTLMDAHDGLGTGFMDVTDHADLAPVERTNTIAYPTQPQAQAVVNPLLSEIKGENLIASIRQLSEGYTNRYYTDNGGVESAKWIQQEFLKHNNGRSDISVELFTHSWAQPSVIAKLQGESDEIIVLGAHEDSTIMGAANGKKMPGADDDASGVANLIEVYRVLAESGFKPKRSIHFIAYAAEEVGLRGSQDIASAYQRDGKNVVAVYQIEMSGYYGSSGKKLATILEDFVDSGLTELTKKMVETYTTIGWVADKCGYGCSDHASWQKAGFPPVCAAEAGPSSRALNPNMHTPRDTAEIIDVEFTSEFAKLALAFAVELSEF
eukprot:TRINITY_DN1246_c0_g1::TRINITY_DN1246_c0_g1_i1::g.26931::m.26931 TRINITY_DN1246_c0_g1::TRINITY_DN1246_c0_g1_i1::g.26931  ORF type:complete len:383 (+),score=130.34,sp/Q01693/AMPX_VIBPR/42.11/2e-61,Peptidase_M28/PF04389.12/4.6e-34,Peptidase_M20/PF01546.23/1.4e-09,Peptidase_M42/PF05343.9/0.00017 TRINITY_DN1246_c0_g1_i1:45-1151(+)